MKKYVVCKLYGVQTVHYWSDDKEDCERWISQIEEIDNNEFNKNPFVIYERADNENCH